MLCLLFGVLFCDVSHLLYHNFQQIARECRIFCKKGQSAGLVAKYEPQATAVELAQLGEGCRGQAAPCKEWVISNDRNLREIIVKCCSPSQKQKTSGKL